MNVQTELFRNKSSQVHESASLLNNKLKVPAANRARTCPFTEFRESFGVALALHNLRKIGSRDRRTRAVQLAGRPFRHFYDGHDSFELMPGDSRIFRPILKAKADFD